MAGYAFYIAFKRYEEDDDFTGGVNSFTMFEVILAVLLFIFEKISPKKYHIAIFKTFSFIWGLFMFGLTVLLWVLFT